MCDLRQAKDKAANNKSRKHLDNYFGRTLVSYKNSKRKKIRRNMTDQIPLIFNKNDYR